MDLIKNNAFLDLLIGRLQLKNDAALSRALDVMPPVISKIRHGRLDIGDMLVIRSHELTGLPVREIKALLGKPCMAPHAGQRLAA